MHDIELNPGPRSPKFPYGICHKAVTSNQCVVACDTCNIWHHTTCIHMSTNTYKSLHNISWHCTSCSIPQLTTSLPNSLTSINNSFSSPDTSTSPTNNRLVSQPTLKKPVKLNKHKHKISKWISHGIIKSIKYRVKLYKTLKMTHHESPNYTILKVNLKSFNTILKKLYVQRNICTVSLLLVEIKPISGTHGKP